MTSVLNQLTTKGLSWFYSNNDTFLKNVENEKVLKIGNQLSSLFTDKENQNYSISIPNIIVIGSQSSGKSSLLNSLIGYDILPTGNNMVTRTPLMLQLNNSNQSKAEFGHYINDKWIIDKNFELETNCIDHVKQKLLHKEIETQTLNRAGTQKNISYNPIILKIYLPNIPDLNLIDLPGLTMIGLTDKGQTKDMPQKIRKMLSNYIKDPKSIILAVIPARTDIEADMGLELIKKYDITGERTCGVLTKVDLMNTDTDISNYLLGNISNELKLKYGYYAVKNRNNSEIKVLTPFDGHKKEKEFFANHRIYQNIDKQDKLGVQNLGKSLSKILAIHIKKNIPDILDDINKKKLVVDQRLENLGISIPSDEKGKISLINKILSGFSRHFSKSINEKCKLNIGLKLKDSFITYRKNILRFKISYTKEELNQIVKGCSGNHMNFSLFSVDILEKGIREYDSIQCLIKPSYKLVTVISNILINLVDIILNEIRYQRFPKLSILIKEYINNIINIQTKKIQAEVVKLIHIEENYIWTEDKNFINNLKNLYIKYKEPNDIKIIEELINQYFDTVKFTFNNNIPKIIMYSLVLKVEKEVFSNLFLFISNKMTPEEILKEPDEIDKERKKLEHFRTKLITAQKILTTS